MGGISRRQSARISAAKAHGCGLHRVFFRNRRPAKRLRADARKLSRAVRRGFSAVAVFARRALPQYHSHQSRNRLHGRLHHAVYRRRNRGASAHFAAGIHPRSVYPLQDHLHGGRAADPEKSGARLARAIRGFAADEEADFERTGAHKSHGNWRASAFVVEPGIAERCSQRFWRRIARAPGRRRVHRAQDSGIFP